MKKTKLILTASIIALSTLVGCSGKSYDETLTVYNWEDYIYEGLDDSNKKVDDSTIESFQKYYQEKTGKTIKVYYKTFSTCEEMYSKISKKLIQADLCCPSDYMIQRMQRENLLESFGYDNETSSYGDDLSNYNSYLSPYIKNLFQKNGFSDFAVPYFWGTMGYTYNPNYISEEQVSTWDFQWNPGNDLNGNSLNKKITIKDSVRDTYFTSVMHVYRSELLTLKDQYDSGAITSSEYNDGLSEIFNRHDSDTLSKCEAALKSLKGIVTLEVDEGKSNMVLEKIYANLAWSGDSVFSMDEAEESDKYLSYSVPEEGSNVWFDGWCMPKGANKEAAIEFVNYLGNPEVAANNMDAVGYTSPIAGQAIWDLVNDWYAADEGVETDEVDLSYFFEGTLDEGVEAKIMVPTEERGRQFDAQYPDEKTIARCAIMKDFGEEGTEALESMWTRVKASLY